MNETWSTALALVVLVAAFAGLVVWVRHDTFTTRGRQAPSDVPDAPAPRRAAPANPVPERRTGVLVNVR